MLYAGVPDAPGYAPTRGASSGSYVIHSLIQAVAVDNGATIISYQIDIDDGLGGDFVEL